MRKRRIALPDGRYLIYYSFDDEKARSAPLADTRDKEKRAGQDSTAEQPSTPEK